MSQMITHMAAVGKREGIQFKFSGKIGNTRDSHRLIAEAGAVGGDLQDMLVNALFHAYFEVNEDISSKETLARIAAKVGLFENQKKGMEFLESDKRGAEVDKEVKFNQYKRAINGVPHFIIDGRISMRTISDVQPKGRLAELKSQEFSSTSSLRWRRRHYYLMGMSVSGMVPTVKQGNKRTSNAYTTISIQQKYPNYYT
jgi:predicted DsbA family dithiol-disulfide isomerase